MNNDEEMLRRYVEAIIIPRKNTDNIKYPIRNSRFDHIISAEYTKEFVNDFNELKNRGHSYKDIGLLFRNPTRIMRNIHHLLKGARLANFSIEQQRSLTLELLEIIKTMKYGNIFNEDKKNIILNPEELSKLMKSKKFIKATKDTAVLIQRLCGVLWAYSETPYFVAHDIGMEEHGLYDYDSKVVMIRDFFNLRPVDLWEECKDFPFNEIRIICVYKKRLKVDFDVFYNIYPREGNFVDDLEEFYLEADGKILNLNETDKIFTASAKIIELITKKVESWSIIDVIKKYTDIYWYRIKPLRDALGKDWKPKESIYENIEKGEIKPDRTRNLTPEDIRNEMGLI